jgi:uncharacterized protein
MENSQRINAMIGIFFSILILLASMTFLPLLKNLNIDKEATFWIGRIAIWICLLLVFLYANQIENQKFLLWNEQQLSILEYVKSFFKIIASIIIGALLIRLLLYLLGGNVEENPKLKEIVAVLKTNYPLLIFTCLTAGITEELIFRGYLMPRLQLFFKNNYASIVISSLLFGLMHIGYGTIFQVLGPMMIGLVFAIHYKKFRNIKILIFCHFFWDLMSLMIASNLK